MPVRRPQRFTAHPGRGALAAERFCARCGARDVRLEKHHWAPRAVFEDADSWPLSLLCEPCHDDWHHKMGWQPRIARKRRLADAIRMRIAAKLDAIDHNDTEHSRASFYSGMYCGIAQLLGKEEMGREFLMTLEGFADGGDWERVHENYRLDMNGYGALVYEDVEEIRSSLKEIEDLIRER